MRAYHTKLLAIFFITILFSFSCGKDKLATDCSDYPRPADAYTFPVVPGTAAWINLKPTERLPAVQIPENVVTKLSTEALIQSWLDFPLNRDIFAGNYVEPAVNFLVQHFNGLAELTKRNDAGSVLLKRYQSIEPTCITRLSEMEQIKFSQNITFIEVILAQSDVLASLSAAQKKLLTSIVLQQYDAKVKSTPVYGAESTLYLGIKVMLEANYDPFVAEMQPGNLVHSMYISPGVPNTDVILNHLRNFAK